jgi:hypothetical protein
VNTEAYSEEYSSSRSPISICHQSYNFLALLQLLFHCSRSMNRVCTQINCFALCMQHLETNWYWFHVELSECSIKKMFKFLELFVKLKLFLYMEFLTCLDDITLAWRYFWSYHLNLKSSYGEYGISFVCMSKY